MAALVCGLATALVVPSAAPAAKVNYSGPVAGPGNEFAQVHLRARINKKGKFTKISIFELRGTRYMTCDDGSAGSVGNSHTATELDTDPFGLEVVKKRFRGVEKTEPGDWYPSWFSHLFEASGRITKVGASGTLRLAHFGDPERGTCETGTVSWTATPEGP
jgi:hypothetical protein